MAVRSLENESSLERVRLRRVTLQVRRVGDRKLFLLLDPGTLVCATDVDQLGVYRLIQGRGRPLMDIRQLDVEPGKDRKIGEALFHLDGVVGNNVSFDIQTPVPYIPRFRNTNNPLGVLLRGARS